MKQLLSDYPKLTFQLLGLFFVKELAYHSSITANYHLYNWEEIVMDSNQMIYNYPLSLLGHGTMIILGGWIANKFPNTKKILLLGSALLLLGFLVSFATSIFFISIGFCLINLGGAIFTMAIILNNAILYPVANGYKDNSFMFFMLISGVAILLSSITGNYFVDSIAYYYIEDPNLYTILVALIAFGLLFGLIIRTNVVGYEILDGTDEEETISSFKVLPFLIIIYATALVGIIVAINLVLKETVFYGWNLDNVFFV